MKKHLFFIVIILFSNNLFSSHDNSDYSSGFLDFCCIVASAKSLHSCGYRVHKMCTFGFNRNSKFDEGCAHCTGLIWTAYGLDHITRATFPRALLYTPMMAHNIANAIGKQFESSQFAEPYNIPQPDKIQ